VRAFDREAVADALERFGGEGVRPYGERVRRMQPKDITRYLTGIVDLAFEHDGRWWILDWKSNHLGDTAAEYDEARMREAMHQHHYSLQYHLYLVALHRHLRSRVPGYDPATHWGGIAYVFLRGVERDQPTGWYRETPSVALIEALDRALGGAGR
jgi:exodeoxyribonuclease V beta subunit